MKHIINVSYRLPVKINGEMQKEYGGLVSILDAIRDQYDIWWIGWPGEIKADQSEQMNITHELKERYQYIPIFLEHEEVEAHFHGFSNSSLWPLLHYISSHANYDERWHQAYLLMIQRFADAVIEHARDGDIVWIHDFHLMMLPSILKKKRPELKIGFFFHTPFPSYELFRCHPKREELLKGVLGADLIGFNTFGFLRHFRSTVLRVLGLESGMNIIPYKGYETRIGVFPVGINWKNFEKIMQEEDFKNFLSQYRTIYKNKRLVLTVDQIDYSKGILKKLQAIENFLENHPDEREQTIFIIIAVPRKEELREYDRLRHNIAHAVGRINGEYSTLTNIPIYFINKSITPAELCALYVLSEVALVTSLMDGMSIVAKEYIACQKKDTGALILSEFSGAAQELFNAIMINPYNINEVAQAIHKALHLTPDERQQMTLPMRNRVIHYDARHWATEFLNELMNTSPESPGMSGTKKIDGELIKLFKDTKTKKALFLDYDGTLREFENEPHLATPSEELKEILNKLDTREDIDTYIISGRNPEFLEEHFGHLNVTLVSEHGYFYQTKGESRQYLIGEVEMRWKEKIEEIFNLYSLSTPGSSVEVKHSAIVWHYRKSDPEFGKWKAGELLGELTEAISNLPVEIHHGAKMVEVSSQHVNKGLAAARFINENKYKTILCAGDDKTDESIFHFTEGKVKTIKIGEGQTDAEYRVATPKKFRAFLKEIV